VVLSPILVRPIREQLEHDRIIRLLQAKYKRKQDVGVNVGSEQVAPVGVGTSAVYPDLVLLAGKKLVGVVEVETSESVNHLEALAEWAPFSKLKAPFSLYVPANSIDTARRLCTDHRIDAAEIWTYHAVGDQMRFTLIVRLAPAAAKPPAKVAPRNQVRPAASRRNKAEAPAARTRPRRATKAAPQRLRATKATAQTARAQKRK
jgi:hypothetical protein